MDISRDLQALPLTLCQIATVEDGANAIAIAQLDFAPADGLRLTNLSHDFYFHPIDIEQSFITSLGQHVRLYRDKAIDPGRLPQGYHATWRFDYGLHSDNSWPEGPLQFNKWALPCDELLRYLRESAMTTGWPNGVFTIELKDAAIMEFEVPAWDAYLRWMKASTWNVQLYDETSITPRSHFMIEYAAPVELGTIRLHEGSLRVFVNWVWQMWLHAPQLSLWNAERHTMLYRADPPQVFSNTHALVFKKELVKTRFGQWLNAWLAIGAREMRAIRQVIDVYANTALSIDLKYVMTHEALVTLAKDPENSDSDEALARHWMKGEQINRLRALKRLERLRFTRNEILHIDRHPQFKEGDILEGIERTRALYQMDAVFRAFVLKLLGEPEQAIDEYVRGAFMSIDSMALRYY